MSTDVTLSDTTQVRIDAGQVEILRSAQEKSGTKTPLEEFCIKRGWLTSKQKKQHWAQRFARWLTT